MFNKDRLLENLPSKPGVYIFKDKKGKPIYIGKAVSIKNRVRSYFADSNRSVKTKALLKHMENLEYIVTDSEVEALILECNLIKKHRPRYNVLLKDDKNYPYIKVTLNEKFPRLVIARKMKKDGAKYFGPYTNSGALRETLRLIRKMFPIRTCKKNLDTTPIKERECLNYHIKRCSAPCQNNISREDYMSMIQDVMMFLSGRTDELVKKLKQDMQDAAEKLDFERAAEIRDQIFSLERVTERQKIVSSEMEDQDVIAMARGFNQTLVQVFFIRKGKLVERESFTLSGTDNQSREEIIESFIKQYYSGSTFIPKEILIEREIEDIQLIEKWLSDKKGSRVYIKVPQRGQKRKLLDMAAQNALLSLDDSATQLANYLNFNKPPTRIEGYDISNIQGSDSVASMVVFEDGKPKKSDYRRFKIKTVEGPDDFSSMREVIYRRFKRGLEEQEQGNSDGKFSKFPDLILIDGGKGQLNAACQALKELGLERIPVISLAKEFEHVFVKERKHPIVLPRDSEGLHLLMRVRDEAHRFAVSYHRKLRGNRAIKSILDEVPGIGPARKKALIKEFGSVENMKKASVEELAKVKGMNRKVAEELWNYINK